MYMLIRNATSYNDLQTKKQLQANLLEVEAQNEAESERRLREFKNPYKPAVVPPKYKTNAEMKRDRLEQTKIAINNVEDLGFDYNKAGEVVAWLGDVDRLVKFNANYKGIKKELSETTNPKLLSSDFLKNYLDRYFEDLEVNYGHKFSRSDVGNAPTPQSLETINLILPEQGFIDALIHLNDLVKPLIKDKEMRTDLFKGVEEPLLRLKRYMPSDNLLAYLKASLTQQERGKLMRNISLVAKSIRLISNNELNELFIEFNGDEERTELGVFGAFDVIDFDKLEIWINKASKALSYATDNNLVKIWNLLEKYAIELQARGEVAEADALQRNIDGVRAEMDADEPPAIPPEFVPPAPPQFGKRPDRPKQPKAPKAPPIADTEEEINDNLTNFFRELEDGADEVELRERLNNVIKQFKKTRGFPNLNEAKMEAILGPKDGPTGMYMDIGAMMRYIEDVYVNRFQKGNYNPVRNPKIKFSPDARYGMGLSKKIEKHLAKDNKEMLKLSKAFKKHMKVEKKVDNGSDSESESDEEMKGSGLKFKHTRIKVGGGVKVEERPTYTHFGKFIIHLPHLIDKNVFNVKYPSRGTIPAIKPLTISEDYRDFILDILDNGKMNERMLNKLPESEIRHFEKVVTGAGLIETLKLKKGRTDSEKKDLDRYNLLRGEIDAGNNSESVIKELRALVVKFINDGRVHKNEGYNLLIELSVL